jgi:GT2 family glycosyltransferase
MPPTTDGGQVNDGTVIVITYNDRDAVLRCMQSVRDHAGGQRVHCVVVDNGSTDGTPAALRDAFPEVELVELGSNHGFPARNHGLRRAQGRWRMFLDSDAYLTDGALPALLACLERHPEIGLVGPRLVYPDGAPQPSARRFPPAGLPLLRRPPLSAFVRSSRAVDHHLMTDVAFDRLREVEYVLGACQLFTSEAQKRAGEIDERIFYGPDDADWCLRVRRNGLKVAIEPAATVVHEYRRRSAARPVSALALRHLRDFAYFQRKWWPHRAWLRDESRGIEARAGVVGG